MPSTDSDKSVIVFDRLFVPSSEVIGKRKPVEMLVGEPFVASNASGVLRQVEGREEVGALARAAGARLRNMLAE